MCFFRKKKSRVYPSVYGEWLKEFQRIGTQVISESDYELFVQAELSDKKYSAKLYEGAITKFLEEQLQVFFAQYQKQIQQHSNINDVDYLNLVVRRNDKKFERLFFFEKLNWLDKKFKEKLSQQLTAKYKAFNIQLLEYFDKLKVYVESMSMVSVNLKRLLKLKG